jgi:hypothetical protein
MMASDNSLATVEQRHALACAYNVHGASGPVIKVGALVQCVCARARVCVYARARACAPARVRVYAHARARACACVRACLSVCVGVSLRVCVVAGCENLTCDVNLLMGSCLFSSCPSAREAKRPEMICLLVKRFLGTESASTVTDTNSSRPPREKAGTSYILFPVS